MHLCIANPQYTGTELLDVFTLYSFSIQTLAVKDDEVIKQHIQDGINTKKFYEP